MINIANLLLLLRGNKKDSHLTGRINIEKEINGYKQIKNDIIGIYTIDENLKGNLNTISYIQGEINNFISNDKIIKLTGIKNILVSINNSTIKTKNTNLIGNKKVVKNIHGFKNSIVNKKGKFNIFHNLISYISGFKMNDVIYIHVKINNILSYTFNKFSKFNIDNTITLFNNIYLKSLKKLGIILNTNLTPEILYIINNINIQIHNIISLSYNEDLIEFESFYRTFRIKATIENDINIEDFNKLINVFINMFYDINGNININLLKEISIKNEIDFETLLRLVNEVGIGINNLIDLTVQNGANFSLAKKINIMFNTSTNLNLGFIATKLFILNDYNNQTLNTMFNTTMNDLTRIIY